MISFLFCRVFVISHRFCLHRMSWNWLKRIYAWPSSSAALCVSNAAIFLNSFRSMAFFAYFSSLFVCLALTLNVVRFAQFVFFNVVLMSKKITICVISTPCLAIRFWFFCPLLWQSKFARIWFPSIFAAVKEFLFRHIAIIRARAMRVKVYHSPVIHSTSRKNILAFHQTKPKKFFSLSKWQSGINQFCFICTHSTNRIYNETRLMDDRFACDIEFLIPLTIMRLAIGKDKTNLRSFAT